MADIKLTDKTALTTPESGDVLHIVDVSDTTSDTAGTSKKITHANLTKDKVTKLSGVTDNRLIKNDGTDGAIQETGVSVDDSDNVSGVNSISVDGEGFQTGDAIDTIAVQGANYDVRAKVEQEGSGNAAQFVNSKFINSGSGCPRIYSIKARGTKSTPLAVQDGDILSCLITGAYDGTEYRVASIVRTQVNDSAPTTGDISADLIFYVSTGTSFEEVLRLDKDKITKLAGNLQLNDAAFTASEILALDGSKNVQTLSTATYPSLAELAYVKGVTSAIQTQLDAKVDSLSVNTETLSANKTLTTSDDEMQNLDPDGTDRDVTLPAEADGLRFTIRNSGSANILQIKNDAGTAQGNPVAIGVSVTVASDGTNWFFI